MSEDVASCPIFALRIVCIDYYMATPLPDLDLGYSALSGATVAQVPVIRIFGSTPAGQKTCLHVHKVLLAVLSQELHCLASTQWSG